MRITKRIKDEFNSIWSRPEEPLYKHIQRVSRLCAKKSSSKEESERDYNMGLYHDFAKVTGLFQDYIYTIYKGEDISFDPLKKQHALLSAIYYYYVFKDIKGFISILYHHSKGDNLKNIRKRLKDSKNIEILEEQIESICNNEKSLDFVRTIYKQNFVEFRNNFKNCIIELRMAIKSLCRKGISIEMYLEILNKASTLQTADKNSLISNKEFEPYSLYNFLVSLKKEKKELSKEDTFINGLRNRAFDEVTNSVKELDLENKMLSIHLPTSLSKTFCNLNASILLQKRLKQVTNNKYKIIYCLPFLSIIEQCEDIFKNILQNSSLENTSNIVLSDNSLSPCVYVKKDNTELSGYDAKFSVGNWQSSFIFTTFVKIFNTLLKGLDRSNTHRVSSLRNSIIIFDEIQSLPLEYHDLLSDFFKVLTDEFNCYIIFSSATQPCISKTFPLIKCPFSYFKEMDRVDMHLKIDKRYSQDEFLQDIKKSINSTKDSHLITLNTPKQCKEMFSILSKDYKDRVYCLNGEILSLHKLEIINSIRQDLKDNKKPIVVTTQVIEAGVDLDFDVVFREFAPLDSIFQICGRCNRHGKREKKGKVFIYTLKDSKSIYVYGHLLLDITKNILMDTRKTILSEKEYFYNLLEAYFKKIKNKNQNEIYIDSIEQIRSGDFKDLRNRCNLITSRGETYIVNYNDESNSYINKIKEIAETNDTYRRRESIRCWNKLLKYQINVPLSYIQKHDLEVSEESVVKVLPKEYYDEKIGLI